MRATKVYPPSHILLAIDGSEHSFSAAAFVRDLALPLECQVNVLAVLIPREASRHTALESALLEVSSSLIEQGVKVSSELITGYPTETLLELIALRRPDLVVLGAKGLRATLGILLGGVVQQLVEYGDAPVLVVRAPFNGIKQVLLVIDGSSHSNRALQYMATLGLPSGIKLRGSSCVTPGAHPRLDCSDLASGWRDGTPDAVARIGGRCIPTGIR